MWLLFRQYKMLLSQNQVDLAVEGINFVDDDLLFHYFHTCFNQVFSGNKSSKTIGSRIKRSLALGERGFVSYKT
ncbi:MAG: hypothetical protein IPP37_09210 [Saprospiraceae bacterium]|nr:hypothetical protein [Saprospiraceae bacterium]